MTTIPTQLLHKDATLPTYGSESAAGMDLYASEGAMIPPGKHGAVATGIAVAIPTGYYGRIAPRSGLAFKQGIDVFAGVIDNDYRGEIKAILYNAGSKPLIVKPGDRIAQMVITPYVALLPEPVESLDETSRGEGGFGSTGK